MNNLPPTAPAATVVVQARMGSSRLPGKMMADLAGKPLITHILQRALAIRPNLPVVLATTVHARDDALARQAELLSVPVIRGSEEDVLGRYLQAMEEFPAPWLVRVCGDSPLFDPDFLDRCLSLAQKEDADVVKFAGGVPSLFQGGEVISYRALVYSRRHAGEDPLAREHVTAWAMRNAEYLPHVLRTVYLEPEPGLMRDIKLSIDTAEDLEHLRSLYAELYDGDNPVDLRAAAAWLGEQGWD